MAKHFRCRRRQQSAAASLRAEEGHAALFAMPDEKVTAELSEPTPPVRVDA
jgi:hypothetical protein